MGVATPWPKEAMPPPPTIKKKSTFLTLPIFVIKFVLLKLKKWLGFKLFY